MNRARALEQAEMRASTLVRLATVSVLLCVVFTYAMATTQSRILSDAFPVISETFVGKPQSSVSEFILGWASLVLFGMSWTMTTYLERYASRDASWRRRARRTMWFGYAAAVALALTATISYDESFRAHITAAFGFLFSMVIWLALVIHQLRRHPNAVSQLSLRVKTAACVAAGSGVFGFLALSGATTKEKAYSWIGACEWIAVLAILLACYTVSWDLDAKGAVFLVRFDASSSSVADDDAP